MGISSAPLSTKGAARATDGSWGLVWSGLVWWVWVVLVDSFEEFSHNCLDFGARDALTNATSDPEKRSSEMVCEIRQNPPHSKQSQAMTGHQKTLSQINTLANIKSRQEIQRDLQSISFTL